MIDNENYPISESETVGGLSDSDIDVANPLRDTVLKMSSGGWIVSLSPGVDVGSAEVEYQLARPVSEHFGQDELEDLGKEIGIVDESGELLEGYELKFAKPEDGGMSGEVADIKLLVVAFRGLRARHSTDTLLNLKKVFSVAPVDRLLEAMGLEKSDI